jgi:NTE family protein
MMDLPMNQGSKRRAAPATIFLLLVTTFLHAQESRQKIGLVLEGGGALGLAHIGVLQWLYQHHVPVDLVAGTSMGGLVGGIYATGRSPEQIQQLIQNVDWDQALSDCEKAFSCPKASMQGRR